MLGTSLAWWITFSVSSRNMGSSAGNKTSPRHSWEMEERSFRDWWKLGGANKLCIGSSCTLIVFNLLYGWHDERGSGTESRNTVPWLADNQSRDLNNEFWLVAVTFHRSSFSPNWKSGLLTEFQISLGMKVGRMKCPQAEISCLQEDRIRDIVRTIESKNS